MSKTASDIVDRALTLIDEVVTTFSTAATTETSIRNQALEILPELCRDLIKELPWGLKRYLGTTAELSEDETTAEYQSGYTKYMLAFTAPSDFWELVDIRLDAWGKPVTDYIYIDSAEYSKQNNPHTRAGELNPVVAISPTPTGGGSRIECFSIDLNSPHTVTSFQYISFDNVPDDDGNDWPDELFDEVTKALASQLQIIKGNINGAAVKGQEITNALEQHE